MLRLLARPVDNEQGGVLVLTALSMTVLLGMAALAIDLGMLYSSHGQMQRAADAAALAGASAFVDYESATAVAHARSRALEYAARNAVGATPVDTTGGSAGVATSSGGIRFTTAEAVVEVLPSQARVSVVLRRTGIAPLFGRVLTSAGIDMSARADAVAMESGSATCLKPLMIRDAWYDVDRDGMWDAVGDHYGPSNTSLPSGYSKPTSYGTTFRSDPSSEGYLGDGYEQDFGRPIVLYNGTKSDLSAGWFGFFRTEETQGASDLTNPLRSTDCSITQSVSVGDSLTHEMGAMPEPVGRAVQDLINLDSDLDFDPVTGKFTRTVNGTRVVTDDWRGSPRVVSVALFDPRVTLCSGANAKCDIPAAGFATLFFDEVQGNGGKTQIVARFLGVFGSPDECAEAGICSPLVRVLRLVK